jgi:hypothetical protein
VTYLNGCVFVRKQYTQNRGSSYQVFHFERILVRIVRWLVIVEHEVDDVDLRGDEGDLEGRVPEGLGRVCPEEVCRSW